MRITPFRLFLAALVVIGYSGQAEEVRITTYNAGLLTADGFNFVPCTTERTEPQAERILNSPLSADPSVHFAILLQEVWTEYGFETYQRLAREKGFSMSPHTYEEVENNGEIIITNMPVLKESFVPYPMDDHAQRGIRSVVVRSDKGPLIISTVHTSYSDSTGFLPAHKDQFRVINQFLDHLGKYNFPIIFAGDFNAGPNMRYRQASYDPAQVIWRDWIAPIFARHKGMHSIGDMTKNTWSEDNNTLVSYPALGVRLDDLYWYGDERWDQLSARLDHIMAPAAMKVIEAGRSMLRGEALPWTCVGREDASGLTPLSDHYAAYAKFVL